MKYEVISIPLEEIVIDQRIQPRETLHANRVSEYAEAYADEQDMPPIKAHEVDDNVILCDGFHRYAAACEARLTHLTCRVRRGSTWGALIVDAIRSNAFHGQPLTQREKRAAISKIAAIYAETGADITQSELADITGTSQATVSRVLNEGKSDNVDIPDEVAGEVLEEPYLGSIDVAESVVASEKAKDGVASDLETEIMGRIEDARQRCASIYQAARKISEWLHELKSLEGGEEVLRNMPMLEQAKSDLMNIRMMSPTNICPHCLGHGCKSCLNRGWVTEGRYKHLKYT